MKKFEAGKEYTHGYATNSDLTVSIKIERRTEKNVWIDGKRKKIYTDINGEYIMPHGFYSMAPSLHSEDLVEEVEEVEEVVEVEYEVISKDGSRLLTTKDFNQARNSANYFGGVVRELTKRQKDEIKRVLDEYNNKTTEYPVEEVKPVKQLKRSKVADKVEALQKELGLTVEEAPKRVEYFMISATGNFMGTTRDRKELDRAIEDFGITFQEREIQSERIIEEYVIMTVNNYNGGMAPYFDKNITLTEEERKEIDKRVEEEIEAIENTCDICGKTVIKSHQEEGMCKECFYGSEGHEGGNENENI